jgi:ribosomal protein L15
MVVRRRKKYRKKLGSRSYHGDTKNRRGKGIKGGRGRAGAWDHKKRRFIESLRGEKGFRPPRKKEESSFIYIHLLVFRRMAR